MVTIGVRYFLVVAARYDKAIPERVLIAPGGIASREVCKESNPNPDMMIVLNVVSPPFGTCRAAMAIQMSQVLISNAASQTWSILKTLDSIPVLSAAFLWMMMYFSRAVRNFASSGLLGLENISKASEYFKCCIVPSLTGQSKP